MVYRRINWGAGSELIDNDKLNLMISNMDHLYENAITGYYNLFGIARETGLTIRAGAAKMIPTQAVGNTVSHTYPRPFSPGVKPIVTSSLSFDARVRVFMGIKGFDGSAVPDHRGFYLTFHQERLPNGPTEIDGNQYYTYIALGYTG